MSDSPNTPPSSRPRHADEYQDPHYHDEDIEIQNDDETSRPQRPTPRKNQARLLRPRRHYEE